MLELPKRKLSEQLQIYKLEPKLKDIFVEGNTDRFFYQYHLGKLNFTNIKVYPIELIDFKDELILEDLGNRNKLIQFSLYLQNNFSDSLKNVTCIIDKDFYDFLDVSWPNYYLILTDYTSLEMYFFNEEVIAKFLQIGLNGFPLTAKELINILGKILQEIFLVKCARIPEFESSAALNLDSAVKVNKDCTVVFDTTEYLKKFLLKNGLFRFQDQFEQRILNLRKKLSNDWRNQIGGKDLISLIFKFIKVVKGNSIGFSEDSLLKTFILLIDNNYIKDTELFKKLILKYS